MGPNQRSTRIDDTLNSLFESLLPLDVVNSDEPAVRDWIDQAVQRAKDAVHSGDEELPSNINQAQDLIKRKLLRENASPEKAARFSNLYSRLLSIPVLSQKWAILYLLHQLAAKPTSTNRDRSPVIEDSPRTTEQRMEERQYRRLESHAPGMEGRHTVESPLRSQRLPERIHPDTTADGLRSSKQPVQPQETHLDSDSTPSELDLLRDLPFNLQGLSSANVEFVSASSVNFPKTLPIPVLSLLHTLAEPCLLYRSLADFSIAQDGGLISQSLRAAISNELRSYLSLVATLEGEIRRAIVAIERGESDRKAIRSAGVTLKRCVIWTRDATMGLRLMSLIVETAKEKPGSQIISFIHSLSSSHGDPFVGGFAERLLAQVARPFYEMLRHWIYDGELVDPYHEFFVVEPDPSLKADIDPRRVATSIWEDKYKLEADMVPTIISEAFAKKVFLIGKSLNFIRNNCGDSDWVIQYSQVNSKPLDYANTSNLESSIDAAYQTTMSRLTHLMSSKFLIFTHLQAMKKYLLLSQGDFIELLVESLAPNLDRPANSQYRHTLTSQLEHAVRHSNAQYDDSEVLRRLDARMIELGRGDTGWDCFTLEYKISAPCDVVITQWASTQYLKIFNLLLRVKRVEYSLNATWRRCMTGARGVLAGVDDSLSADWKHARCVVAEMVHFVNQLQYYILFEVIESSWETLQSATQKPDATLDDLIDAHTKYINTITQKGLLASSSDREDGFLVQLHHILRCMLSYRDVVDSLYAFSVAEYTKRQQLAAKIEHRTAQGKWGITEKDMSRSSTPAFNSRPERYVMASSELDNSSSPPVILLPSTGGDDQSILAALRTRLQQLGGEFRSKINVFLYDLAHQPDVDMRFLGIVMNFNEVYKPTNPRRQQRRERTRKEVDPDTRRKQSRDVNSAGMEPEA